VYSFSAMLPNKAGANINISTFASDTTVPFADQSVNVSRGSVKYTLSVSQWPFALISNQLEIGIDSQAQSNNGDDDCEVTNPNIDSSDTLRSITLSINGYTLYGRFLDTAIIDGVVQRVQFSYDSSSSETIATVPHFWDSAVFDPDYQVLLDPNIGGCNKHSKNITGKVVGGVVGGVVGLALIVAIIMFFFVKRHEREVDQILANSQKALENYDDSEPALITSTPKSPSFERSSSVGKKPRLGIQHIDAGNPSVADTHL